MKINVNQIPPEGMSVEENIPASGLGLEPDMVNIRGPVRISASVSRITNAVEIDLDINASAYTACSRCLNEIDFDLRKNLRLDYAVDKSVRYIDLGPQIREEVILEYPVKPLCKPDCLGLCPKCGKNLNEGKCSCI